MTPLNKYIKRVGKIKKKCMHEWEYFNSAKCTNPFYKVCKLCNAIEESFEEEFKHCHKEPLNLLN